MNKRIKELRIVLGLNQTDFAESIGVTRGVIANIELGRVKPREGILNMLMKIYDVNKNWLLNNEGNMFYSSEKNIELEKLMNEAKNNSFLCDLLLKISKLDSGSLDFVDELVNRISK